MHGVNILHFVQLKSLGWFGNKHEEAADLFEKAANNFKVMN